MSQCCCPSGQNIPCIFHFRGVFGSLVNQAVGLRHRQSSNWTIPSSCWLVQSKLYLCSCKDGPRYQTDSERKKLSWAAGGRSQAKWSHQSGEISVLILPCLTSEMLLEAADVVLIYWTEGATFKQLLDLINMFCIVSCVLYCYKFYIF